jgi:hypothetical protein
VFKDGSRLDYPVVTCFGHLKAVSMAVSHAIRSDPEVWIWNVEVDDEGPYGRVVGDDLVDVREDNAL